MSEVWPNDVRRRNRKGHDNSIRSFKCLLLMPFDSRFNQVAELIRDNVKEVFDRFPKHFEMEQADINRLDWITSSGVIQNEIWKEIETADLVFCDITGFNPNVLFEAGVCAAWKELHQVVFVRDRFFKVSSPFDIAPIRYTEYELTSNGIPEFVDKIQRITETALMDSQMIKLIPTPYIFLLTYLSKAITMISDCILLRLPIGVLSMDP